METQNKVDYKGFHTRGGCLELFKA